MHCNNLILVLYSTCQYSDLAEGERVFILEKFRQVTTRWNQINRAGVGSEDEVGKEEDRPYMLVVTDACLPLLAYGESPVSSRLLINYELPVKKVWSFFSKNDIFLDEMHSHELYLLCKCKNTYWYMVIF